LILANISHIAKKFEQFIFSFTIKNENFRKAYVFENPVLTFDVNRQHYLKKSFFTMEEWNLYGRSIKNLTMDQILGAGGIVKSKMDFETSTRIFLSDLKFNKIRGLALTATAKYEKNNREEKRVDTVQNFLMRIKKGSKRIRAVLRGTHECIVSANISKFAELTNTFINCEESRILNLAWSFGYLQNTTRTFIFKLHNNTLGINSRVAHFVRGHPNTCTFCDLTREPEENVETTLHLFF